MQARPIAAVTAVLMGLLLGASARGADPLQVQTDKGKVLGALTADRKVAAFKGIPYAAPPLEDLRWKTPQPAVKWKGVRPALDFGSRCIQSGGYPDMVFHDPGESEDCLTLNVWTPVAAKPVKPGKAGGLPVMVWIYGGGFTTGGTSENRQDGQFLAHRDVVVVSMNYRLGFFGFLALPDLAAESPHRASGNYGLLDQVAALIWVKRNIAAFGGDPEDITIFGESAGSFSVSALMASPISKDLIAKAIGESGAAFHSGGLGFPAREDVETTDAKWAERVFATSRIFYLRQVPVGELMKAAMAAAAPRFGPDIDGFFLPESLPRIFSAGQQAHIPVLGGWNADEARQQVIDAKTKTTAASFAAQARAEFGADAAAFLAAYGATTDAAAERAAGDYAGDEFIAYSTWAWLDAQARTGGAPVYRYRLDLGSPGDRNHEARLGAFHSDDIEYVFGALDSRPGAVLRPEDRKLSDQMMEYWTNFARTGNPNGPGLPQWPAYRATDGWQVMHLDVTSQAKPDALRPRYLFLDRVWVKPGER